MPATASNAGRSVVGRVVQVLDVVLHGLVGEVALADRVHQAADEQPEQGDYPVIEMSILIIR